MIALVVGHKSTSPGAQNRSRALTEFEFNTRLALDVWRRLSLANDVKSTIVFRRTYSHLPSDINDVSPSIVVAMHANASKYEKASGTEVLYYHRSNVGAKIATVFQNHFLEKLQLRDRGIKPIDSEGRGGTLLKNTFAPTIICEPFFIDNDDDLDLVSSSSKLADAYVSAIQEAKSL